MFAALIALLVPVAAVANDRSQLMATLNGLNARYGRGTVRLGSAMPQGPVGGRPPWQGQV